ncbi:hypothetical protein DKX38_026072 [Salix brachista]|uniref:Uncharacterized protein n=1 Tax=Salix brachista TaxID=2182728 RepID=A0A5N5JVS6_9ROSI|nr:hypothetical protein DKX38_026072 [Salix brachista]
MCFFLPGNYLKVKDAIRSAYPDIKIISNYDGSSHSLDHPADYYDFQVFTSASNLFPRLISLIAHPALIQRCVICFYDNIWTKIYPKVCFEKELSMEREKINATENMAEEVRIRKVKS